MTIREHIRELKKRALFCLIFYIITFFIIFYFSSNIISLMMNDAVKSGYVMITAAMQEIIVQKFRIAGVGGLIASMPIILWNILAYWSEPKTVGAKVKIFLIILLIMILITAGALFATIYMVPFIVSFLYGTTLGLAGVQATVTMEKYIGFYIGGVIGFGVMALMPVMAHLLTRMGLCNARILRKIFPYFAVVAFIAGAILTPPDVTSQIMVAVPLIGMYWVSVLISKLTRRKKKEAEVVTVETAS